MGDTRENRASKRKDITECTCGNGSMKEEELDITNSSGMWIIALDCFLQVQQLCELYFGLCGFRSLIVYGRRCLENLCKMNSWKTEE